MDWYNPPKMGVCENCGYRISEDEQDEMELIDGMKFTHGRCYKND